MSAEVSPQSPPIDQLAEELAQLRDLFQRRLFEDRRRQELYDRLYQELDFARSDLVRQFIAPLCRELLLMLDRLQSMRGSTSPVMDALASIESELSEVLARRGIRPMDTEGVSFDPKLHEAVDTVEMEGEEADLVVEQRRTGYLMDSWVLRPAQVVVGRRR